MHAVETVQKYVISQVLVPSEAQNTKDAVKPIKKIVKEGFSTVKGPVIHMDPGYFAFFALYLPNHLQSKQTGPTPSWHLPVIEPLLLNR